MGCKLFKLGNVTGIICGAKKNHECDDNGPVWLSNNNGEYFNEANRPDWNLDQEGYVKWMEDRNITGGGVSCSICGEPFSPPMF